MPAAEEDPGRALVPVRAQQEGPTRFAELPGAKERSTTCVICGEPAAAFLAVQLNAAGQVGRGGANMIRRYRRPVCEVHGAQLADKMRRAMRA